MKLTKMMLAAAAAFAISGVVMAEDGPPKFAAADANGDGGVDAAEFEATGLEREFAKLDKDGDGKLNNDEYAAALEEDCE